MTFSSRVVVFASALAAALLGQSADASTIYSNFGPGYTYDCCLALNITGSASFFGATNFEAAEFIPAKNASLGQINLPIAQIFKFHQGVRVSLWTRAGAFPDVEIGSWPVVGPLPYGGQSNDRVFSVSGITGIHLVAGTKYYLEVEPANPASDIWQLWNMNALGLTGTAFAYNSNTGWITSDAFLLPAFNLLTEVPEPSALGLFATAALLVRRRKSRSV